MEIIRSTFQSQSMKPLEVDKCKLFLKDAEYLGKAIFRFL